MLPTDRLQIRILPSNVLPIFCCARFQLSYCSTTEQKMRPHARKLVLLFPFSLIPSSLIPSFPFPSFPLYIFNYYFLFQPTLFLLFILHSSFCLFSFFTFFLANDLQVPRPRLVITTKSFSYEGAKVWNDIPNNIRNVESAALFKKQFRKCFLGQLVIEDPLKHDLLEEQCDSIYSSLSLFLLFEFLKKIKQKNFHSASLFSPSSLREKQALCEAASCTFSIYISIFERSFCVIKTVSDKRCTILV